MSPLERFAARCASEPSFLAFALTAYQRRNGFTDEILASGRGNGGSKAPMLLAEASATAL